MGARNTGRWGDWSDKKTCLKPWCWSGMYLVESWKHRPEGGRLIPVLSPTLSNSRSGQQQLRMSWRSPVWKFHSYSVWHAAALLYLTKCRFFFLLPNLTHGHKSQLGSFLSVLSATTFSLSDGANLAPSASHRAHTLDSVHQSSCLLDPLLFLLISSERGNPKLDGGFHVQPRRAKWRRTVTSLDLLPRSS